MRHQDIRMFHWPPYNFSIYFRSHVCSKMLSLYQVITSLNCIILHVIIPTCNFPWLNFVCYHDALNSAKSIWTIYSRNATLWPIAVDMRRTDGPPMSCNQYDPNQNIHKHFMACSDWMKGHRHKGWARKTSAKMTIWLCCYNALQYMFLLHITQWRQQNK